MVLPPDILRANAEFIDRLSVTDTRVLAISAEGRIGYRARSICTRLFASIIGGRVDSEPVLRRSVEQLVRGRALEGDGAFRAYLTGVLSKLASHGALSPALHQQILGDHQKRIVDGYRARLDATPVEEEGVRGGAGAGPVVAGSAYEERASRLKRRADVAMEMSIDPLLTDAYRATLGLFATDRRAGASESFFIKDLNKKIVGVFKPRDGEVGMPSNSRGLWRETSDEGHPEFVRGVKIGTMYQREVAASKFCYGKLGTVPVTRLYTVRGALSPGGATQDLVGSLQEFVEGSWSYDDYAFTSPVSFLAHSSLPTIHGLVLRDLLMGSCDRHMGNVLFKEGVLYGIDNGMSFPEGLLYHSGPISGTVSHIAVREGCQRPLSAEIREAFLSIDLEAEIDSLTRDGLITDRQAIELKMRHSLLTSLLDEPFLNVYHLSVCFSPDSTEDSPIVVQMSQRAWDRFAEEMPGVDRDHLTPEMRGRFLSIFGEEIGGLLTLEFLSALRAMHPSG